MPVLNAAGVLAQHLCLWRRGCIKLIAGSVGSDMLCVAKPANCRCMALSCYIS